MKNFNNINKFKRISLITSIILGNVISANATDYTLTGGTTALNQTLSDDSTLVITGTNNITGSTAIKVDGSVSNYTINITNNGIINTDGISSTINGIEVSRPGSSSLITNNGTIKVNGSTSSRGIFLASTSTSGTVTNSGTINAYTSGSYNKTAFSLLFTNTGSTIFNNTSSGVMNGNIVWNSTLNNSGKISLPYNATNATINTFNNNGTGILELGLSTDGTTTTHSKLSSTDATFQSGSTINVNVLSSSTNLANLDGTTITDVVSASNLLTIITPLIN